MKTISLAALSGIVLFVTFTSLAVDEITSTEYSSEGFKITKVMTNPKKLNALGKMAQFGDSNAVGKYTELNKDLPPEEQGEEFIINWKYTGTASVPNIILRLEYITGKITEIRVYEKSYTAIKSGAYELALKNIGDNYISRGEIAHWRVSLVSKNKVLASRESRMWNAFYEYARKQSNND